MLFILLLLVASSASLIGLAAGDAGLAALGTGAGLVLLHRRFRRRDPSSPSRDAVSCVEPTSHPTSNRGWCAMPPVRVIPTSARPKRRELATAVTAQLSAVRDRR